MVDNILDKITIEMNYPDASVGVVHLRIENGCKGSKVLGMVIILNRRIIGLIFQMGYGLG